MLILGLDLGTNCGWAVLDGKRRVDSGTWKLGTEKRYSAFQYELGSTLLTMDEMDPDFAVAYESVHNHRGYRAAHVYGGLLACVEMEAESWPDRINFHPIGVGTWKKATVGHGRAGKPDVMQWAKRRFRYTPKTQDEADALGVADAARIMVERGEL